MHLSERVLVTGGAGFIGSFLCEALTAKIERRPLPIDDPKQRQPDISLARKVLGWQPSVRLDVGLESTIAYFEEFLQAAPGEAWT